MSTGSDHDVFLVPSQFSSIQEAINAIVRPSTIMVSPGVYYEDLLFVGTPGMVISTTRFGRRGVTLVGATAAAVVRVENASIYLSGIEIRSNGRARAISAVASSVALQECVLAGNRVSDADAGGEGAAMLCIRSSVRVQKSMIAGNSVQASDQGASGGALHLVDCKVEIAGSSIQANAVYGSVEARGGGIYCERVQMRMWRSRVTDNALYGLQCEGAGIYFQNSSAQLGGSVITGNGMAEGRGGGIFVSGQSEQVVVHGNTFVRQNHPDDITLE
ncbi:MAG TPA: right-handed parallel beta-helix repeat-containing protein [Anaerolineae bacterium]|nr:right-handed parallel beta-helix repeat-containing protein [Anaerolineae bacterium]